MQSLLVSEAGDRACCTRSTILLGLQTAAITYSAARAERYILKRLKGKIREAIKNRLLTLWEGFLRG